jgi:predicted aspartyl protease
MSFLRHAGWLALLLSIQLPTAAFTQEVSIPFIILRDHLIAVNASSGSMKKGIFIIDTGTYHTIIDEHVVSELELPIQKWHTHTGTLNSLGMATLDMVTLPDFRLGPIRIHSLPVQSRQLGRVGALLGTHFDGFIGMDVLEHSRFCIDFVSRKIRFGAWRPEADGVTGKPDLPFLVVKARINGQSLELKLDTGACHMILYEGRMGDELRKQSVIEKSSFYSLAGVLDLPEIKLDEFRIGSAVWQNHPRCFVAPAMEHGLPYDGLVGLVQLGFKRVYLDFESNCLRWERQQVQ